ncbi:MAG: lipopolysaccharide biosynthesis protein, partial [Paraglaciecola sp.]
MTKQAQLELEQRFADLKASLSHEQWADADFLTSRVDSLELIDITLAFRLMQRVKNLSPTQANQLKLKELRVKALEQEPELATLSSNEATSRKTMLKNNAVSLKDKMVVLSANPKLKKFKRPFALCVILPFLLFTFYQVIWASPRYESQAQLIVKEPDGMATLDPAMAIMSGFGVGSGSLDTELVKAFVYSNDMLSYLENTLEFSTHYSNTKYDFFSRLSGEASRETVLKYYLDRVL